MNFNNTYNPTHRYPFGMLARSSNDRIYRFRFNGKEKDDEISGGGNIYDYGFRIYNPRLGKFLSTDPLFQTYPWLTFYQFAANDPIRNIDIDGLEGGSTIEGKMWDEFLKPIYDAFYWLKDFFEQPQEPDAPAEPNPKPEPSKPSEPVNTEKNKPVVKKVDEKKVEKTVETNNLDYVSAPWMKVAYSQEGVKEQTYNAKGEGQNDGPEVEKYLKSTGLGKGYPWCSAFCNWVMNESGYDGTGSAKALSWKEWGKSTGGVPVFGAIAVIDYGNGKGHVGFVVGVEGDNVIILLGGNQRDQVKESKFKKSSIIDYRVPLNYKITNEGKDLKQKKINDKTETIETTR